MVKQMQKNQVCPIHFLNPWADVEDHHWVESVPLII